MTEHTIISISVEKEELGRIERARKEHGFAERSGFWRKAMNEYLAQLEEKRLTGTVRGALVIVHEEGKEELLHELKHAGIVTTHLHNHFRKAEECLEVLILEGEGKRVEEMLTSLRQAKSVRFVRFVRA